VSSGWAGGLAVGVVRPSAAAVGVVIPGPDASPCADSACRRHQGGRVAEQVQRVRVAGATRRAHRTGTGAAVRAAGQVCGALAGAAGRVAQDQEQHGMSGRSNGRGHRRRRIEKQEQHVSHPFKDQMECILLCVPRDQSHIS
jgi:hypothetical protein